MLVGLLALGSWPCLATIPEPDNLVYGAIYLGSIEVTSAQTDVRVEARRTPTGPALASYRMGDSAAAGNFYSLSISMEALSPVTAAEASLAGQTLYLVVLDSTGARDQKPFVLGVRGRITRIDFGSVDSDQNGLPDDWERRYWGDTGQDPNADSDLDSLSNQQEFLGNRHPLLADAPHPADLNPTNNVLTIDEVTAYALAWRTGQPWPINLPTNVPNADPEMLNYVTRAGFLWKGGEQYWLDTNAAPAPPLWWVNGQRVGLSSLLKSESAAPAETKSVVERSLPGSFRPNEPVAVVVTIRPAGAVRAYAVEENVPEGWQVGALTGDGVFDQANGKLKWGPFFDAEPRTLKYDLTPAGPVLDEVSFQGTASFDGRSTAVAGSMDLVRAGFVRLQPPSVAMLAGLRVTLRGEPRCQYMIETSQDLVHWVALGSLTTDPDGRGQFQDTGAPGLGWRFYRAQPIQAAQ